MKYEEKEISREHIYKGSVISVESLKVELPNGKTAPRDLVLHPGASVVIPITENGELYMVRQFRKPLDMVSLEVPAGKLDPGEDPMDCARRELKEETGLTAKYIRHAISIHTTPGFCNEVIHMYVATGLEEGESCADEDEFISSEKIPVSQLLDKVIQHEITDAKTIIAVLLAERIIRGELQL